MALNKRSEKGSPLTHNEVDANWTQLENWLAGKAPLNHTHSIANVTGLQVALDARMLNSQRGVANGVASLGSDGKVPMSQLPAMSGSSGMLFPHETLTGADVGKLVIWKDGKAQLPVFEDAVEELPIQVKIPMNLAGFHDFNPDNLILEFSTNPNDGDTLALRTDSTYTFKDTVTGSREVLIGADISETINNLIVEINNYDGYNNRLNYDTATTATLVVINRGSGIANPFSFSGNYFEGYGFAGSAITLSTNFVNAANRVQDCIVPFVLVAALGFYSLENKYTKYFDFYRSVTSFTQAVTEDGINLEYYPSSLEELKEGIAEFLNNQESIYSASWTDNDLIISFPYVDVFELFTLEIDPEFTDYWNDAFGTPELIYAGSVSTPSFCNFSILGLVKSVGTPDVEIYTEPICTFKSTHGTAVNWENLMDLNRCFVLDPDNVGYLKPITSIEISSLDTLFVVASAGYVTALDKNIGANSNFIGAFSLDLFALQVLYLLFNSEDEGGG